MAATLREAIARISRIEAEVASEPKTEPKQAAEAEPPAPQQPLTSAVDSAIVTDFPAIFDVFRGKRFSLLWRGGRDGFGAKDFHRRGDWHANTLTLIETSSCRFLTVG
jgi:hypothetical protein